MSVVKIAYVEERRVYNSPFRTTSTEVGHASMHSAAKRLRSNKLVLMALGHWCQKDRACSMDKSVL